jgi:pimeloyl-ACP methyl ester carboxylesterase
MKTFTNNRDGKKICVVVDGPLTSGKLAFVMHGLGGNKDELHIRAMIEGFLEAGYTVVSFDAAHTFGESEGAYENATVTNYYADLVDVIAWSASQTWYAEPFVPCGHSLGGISGALYAQASPAKIRALACISTVVSGKLSAETYRMFPEFGSLDTWKQNGSKVTLGRDGREKRLMWSHMEDRLKYDLVPQAYKLVMPVLLVVGGQDNRTPVQHQQVFFDALPTGNKEMHIVKGALHSFVEPHEQEELKRLVKAWAGRL